MYPCSANDFLGVDAATVAVAAAKNNNIIESVYDFLIRNSNVSFKMHTHWIRTLALNEYSVYDWNLYICINWYMCTDVWVRVSVCVCIQIKMRKALNKHVKERKLNKYKKI